MDSDLGRTINNYCERLDAQFWAEPLNAVTNAAFIIAAVVALIVARQRDRLTPMIVILASLVAAIGVGSFLFHTYATVWAAIADVVPILLFIVIYLFVAARYMFGVGWRIAAPAALGAFILALSLREIVLWLTNGQSINGSEGYAPALGLMIGAATLLGAMRRPAAIGLAAAAGVFLVSLTARSTDMILCEAFPIGTHFLWHILNGVVLGILLITLIRHGEPRAR